MKISVLAAALALAVPLAAGAQSEEVKGFRGYPWGTPREAIPEIAGTQQVGVKDSLPIYSKTVTVNGKEALAGFYFHPKNGGLVEGYYVFPIALEECEQEWSRYLSDLEEAYPTLRREEKVPHRPAADSTRYVSDCEYFIYRGETEEWSASLVNPDPPGDRAGAWINVVGRSLQMTIFYRGGAGEQWESRFRWPRLFRERPEAPPGESPPTTPTQPRPGSGGLPVGRA